MNRAGKSSKRKAKPATKGTSTKKASAKRASAKKAAPKKATAGKATAKKLQLAEVLDLTAAAPLAKSLQSHRGSQIDVDASRVRRVGAQCLQVLLAAEAAWKADSKGFHLVKPSEAFLEGSRLLGIQIDQSTARQEQA